MWIRQTWTQTWSVRKLLATQQFKVSMSTRRLNCWIGALPWFCVTGKSTFWCYNSDVLQLITQFWKAFEFIVLHVDWVVCGIRWEVLKPWMVTVPSMMPPATLKIQGDHICARSLQLLLNCCGHYCPNLNGCSCFVKCWAGCSPNLRCSFENALLKFRMAIVASKNVIFHSPNFRWLQLHWSFALLPASCWLNIVEHCLCQAWGATLAASRLKPPPRTWRRDNSFSKKNFKKRKLIWFKSCSTLILRFGSKSLVQRGFLGWCDFLSSQDAPKNCFLEVEWTIKGWALPAWFVDIISWCNFSHL